MLQVPAFQDTFRALVDGTPRGNDARNKISLLIPLVASTLSASILLIKVLTMTWSLYRSRQNQNRNQNGRPHIDTDTSKLPLPLSKPNMRIIRAFNVLKLLGCLMLFMLSLYTLRNSENGLQYPNLCIAATYFYTTVVSIGTVLGSNRTLAWHVDLMLLTVFAVFAYRDIWPLATYTQEPVDSYEGRVLWVKMAILAIISVFVFLFVPRQYAPVDPKHPMDTPNPEQIASTVSMIVYSYLDPVIYEAYRVPHLSHERLPPLPDYDRAEYLIEKAFPYLDPFRGAKKQHLFFGILRVFFKEFLQLVVLITLLAISNYIPAIALNKVLASLESQSAGQQPADDIRPWFWVLCLFLGPLFVSLSLQRYAFVATTLVARTQAIMTQLIFEHSLRVRVIAETSGGEDTKDKGKATTGKAPKEEKESNLIGKINTMVAVDIGNLGGGKDFLMVVLQGPIELTIATAILWNFLGWSAIVGLASIILLLPLPAYIGGKMQMIHLNRMRKTDDRVQSVIETLSVIRMIKMFGWENKMRETLDEKREEELAWLWKDKMINLLNELLNFMIPTITMLLTYATYTLVMEESLNASKVFASAAVFANVRGLMRRTSTLFGLTVKAKVSLDRISKYLLEAELLDGFSGKESQDLVSSAVAPLDADRTEVIGFRNAEFSWSKAVEGEAENDTQLSPSFRLRIQGELTFKRGGTNLIFGPTGSGKTSILMALLGEMHYIPSGAESWYNLPRGGGIAYAAQESWVLNDTIKSNILFGLPYDEERYEKVIHQCALSRDLELFDAGDETEVGERGVTLSGGQKARVTLARAIYSSAEILLLDDVLAALDAHTARWIVKECLQGDLTQGRTVLLVIHNVALVCPIEDRVVSVGPDRLARSVPDAQTLASDYVLATHIPKLHCVDLLGPPNINIVPTFTAPPNSVDNVVNK